MKNEEKKKLFKLGNRKIEEKNFNQAFEIFNKLIENFSNDDSLYNNRGLINKRLGKIKDALNDFTNAIKINKKNDVALYNRSEVLLNQSELNASLLDINKALKLVTNNASYYNLRGVIYARQNKYDKAIKDFNKSIIINNNYLDPRFNLAKVYFDLKYSDKAIECYLKIIELDPKNVNAYHDLSLYYRNVENYEEAINVINKAIEFDSNNPSLYNRRGICYALWKKYDLAKIDFEKSKEFSKNKYVCQNLGYLAIEQKYYEEAINNYNEILDDASKNEDNKNAFYWRGYAFYKTHKYKQALKDITKADELNFRIDNICILKGLIYACLGNNTQAESLLSNISPMDIILLFGEEEASIMLDAQMKFKKSSNFFQSLLKAENIKKLDSSKYKRYKEIYLKVFKIIALLHAGGDDCMYEKTVAHYTQKTTAESLLFSNSDSEFRMSTVINANDPQEGKVLIDFLRLKDDNKINYGNPVYEDNYQAFIGSFTFNHDCLNQFRLYGKQNGIEATGVSLVVNSEFFNKKVTDSIHYNATKDENIDDHNNSNDKNELSDKKYSLYRCLYIDPLTAQVISIGHREEYTFYRAHNFINITEREDAIKSYNEYICEKLKIVKSALNDLRDLVTESISNTNKKDSILNKNVIIELIMMLSYLTKHMAFKEEQECRILSIENVFNNDFILPSKNTTNYNEMYLEYLPMKDYVKSVYFAPKTKGLQLFYDQSKRYGLNINCRQSVHPLT